MLYKTHKALQAACYFILMFTESTECESISEMLHFSLLRVVGSGRFESLSAKIHKIQDVLVPVKTGFILVVARRGHGQNPKVISYHLGHFSGAGERESLLGRSSSFQLRKCGGGSHMVLSIIAGLFSMDRFFFYIICT